MKFKQARSSLLTLLFTAIYSVSSSQPSFILCSNLTHINKILPNSSTPVPLIYNLVKAVALDVDVTAGHVYWTDVAEKSIKRANIDGSGDVTDIITTSIGSCDGIAVEWITRRLYWTDTTYHVIQVAELDGSHRRILIDRGLDKPRGIAVHPEADLMFWTDWGKSPKIERSTLSGLSRMELITHNIKEPNEITIDYSTNHIFWVDSHYNWIQTTDLDGNSRQTLFQQKYLQPFGISVLHNILYWTEWRSKGIHVTNIKTRETKSGVIVGNFPMGVAAYDVSRQPPVSRKFMLIADSRGLQGAPAVYKVSVDTPNHNRVILSVNNTKAITYDPIEDRVYWIDKYQRNIRRAFLNMTGEEAFNSHSVRPETLAVDWLGRHLYWTDAWTRRIEAARLDNGLQTSVIITAIEKPRGLVLDPPKGQMYWTDWGSKPKIEVANMDGTTRWTLEDYDLKWPNALTIDRVKGRIYWVDAGKNTVESKDLSGKTRRTEYKGRDSLPFSLAFFKGYIFWSDVSNHSTSVHKLDISTQKSVPYVKSLSRPIDVFIYDPSNYPKVTSMCKNAGCSHLCLVRYKGYTCACPSGYKLQADKKTCERARQFILFVDGGAPSVNILPLEETQSLWTPISILPPNSEPSDFDYDPITDAFYWTDTATGSINSYNMAERVFKSLHRCNVVRPMGIAVDWVGGNIYWTDSRKGTIEVSRTDGTMRRVLFKTPNLTAIVLDLKEGRIYASVCGTPPKIIKLFMDGSLNTTLVTRGLQCPTSLTFDHQSHRLYWIDVNKGVIESVMPSNANREVLYLDKGVFPRGFALNGKYAYISDERIGRIYRIGLHDKSNVTLADVLTKPTLVRHFDRAQLNVSQKCSVNNGGCSDLCLLSAGRRKKCACSTGGKLLSDGKTCSRESFEKGMSKKALLIADMDYQDIFKVPLDTKESFCQSIYKSDVPILGIESTKIQPLSITYNPSDKLLYWTDVRRKAVMRGTRDGKDIQVVARMGILTPDGIDVDYISQNVYWTDTMRKRIEVSKLDGSDRRVLIGSNLDQPGAIVVDPVAGNMYWADYGSDPKIEKAHMDGSNRKPLIKVSLERPTGLALDFRLRRLYWTDEGTETIESINLDGSNRKTEFSISSNEKRAPFGLAFNGGNLYWADVLTRSIYQLEVATGLLTVVASGFSRPVDVRVVGNMEVDIVSNECSNRNGGCSNLCLPVPAIPGFKCSCPEGVSLKHGDDMTCEGVNRCPQISGLKHGQVDANCRNIPGGVCNVTCDVGFKLHGKKKMRCHGNGSWSTRLPRCDAITCFSPLKPKYGHFDLAECNNGTQPVRYGVTCKYLCDEKKGFVREGPLSTTCQSSGMWTMSRIPTSCRDDQAPVIVCPNDITHFTEPGQPHALVNWTTPKTYDNADPDPVLTVQPPGTVSPHLFRAGKYVVMFQSTDSSGLTSSCSFDVTVLDKEPPEVVECTKNFTFITKQQISRVYFSGINFSDNVGVTKVDFGNVTNVAWGNHPMTVRAYDGAGNTAECDINVLVYSEICKVDAPVNGFKTCNTWRDGGVFCSISCKKGYAFTGDLHKFYMCSHSERWRNAINYADGRSRLPDCSKIAGFTELSIIGELHYDAEKCLQTAVLRSIENKVSQLLRKYLISTLSICDDNGSCNLGDISLSCNSKSAKAKRRTKRTEYNKEMKARFEIRVYLKSAVGLDAVNQTRREMQSLFKDGVNISDFEIIIEGYVIRFDTRKGLNIYEIRGICGAGQVYRKQQCVKCPIGHYHNQTTDSCERCPVNTYQEKEGQVTCTLCKAGLTTIGLKGAWSNAHCRECSDFEKTEIKVECGRWRRAGECTNNRPKMFDKCPLHCGFCVLPGSAIKTQTKRRHGVNLKAVIPALVVPTVILVSIVLLVVVLLRRKRRRRDENKLSLDTMIKKKITLDKPINNDNYKCALQVQQLHVRFHEDKKSKKKNRNKNKTDKPSPLKTVLKKEKKTNDEEEMYVRIPLKDTQIVANDKLKKSKKKKIEKTIPEEENKQISTCLELQEISAQMDATQV